MSERVAVIGAGSWGTALANLLAGKGIDTVLWSHEPTVAEGINTTARNPRYLSDIELDPRLRATADMEQAVTGADVLLSVSPSHVVREVMRSAAEYMRPDALVVSASKGIEVDTLQMMDQVLGEVLPQDAAAGTAFLSGPSFALEVGLRHPTAVTMASESDESARRAQALFQTDYFRVYTHADVRGVELAGALKNVIAIAAGVVDGLGFGSNTQAALITRGLAEMSRLGAAIGADPVTFAGLAGMGDLILTCTGALSRNRQVGVELGRGGKLPEILAEMTMVAEGVRTTRSARDLAARIGTPMPIVEEVHSVLFENRPPAEALERLMLREPKAEYW